MQESVIEKIIGTWKLVSWVYQNEKGETIDYFGKEAKGILMYDRSGYMNAQLMRGDRPNFLAGSMAEGTPEEIRQAYTGYAAYYGRYHERAPGVLIHTVEGSLFPNWEGHDEIRYATFKDGFLILSAPPVKVGGREIIFYVTWRRA